MVEEKLYVDDEINLEKLALKLGVTRHQLSQVLNEHAGLNFFEYINQRRIEAVSYTHLLIWYGGATEGLWHKSYFHQRLHTSVYITIYNTCLLYTSRCV